MSFIFAAGADTVWSPALRVGQTFVRCAQALSDAVEVPAGFVFNGSDMVDLDVAQLDAFARALAEVSNGPHRVYASLAQPVWAPCVVMLRRAGVSIDVVVSETAGLVEALAASMPV